MHKRHVISIFLVIQVVLSGCLWGLGQNLPEAGSVTINNKDSNSYDISIEVLKLDDLSNFTDLREKDILNRENYSFKINPNQKIKEKDFITEKGYYKFVVKLKNQSNTKIDTELHGDYFGDPKSDDSGNHLIIEVSSGRVFVSEIHDD